RDGKRETAPCRWGATQDTPAAQGDPRGERARNQAERGSAVAAAGRDRLIETRSDRGRRRGKGGQAEGGRGGNRTVAEAARGRDQKHAIPVRVQATDVQLDTRPGCDCHSYTKKLIEGWAQRLV